MTRGRLAAAVGLAAVLYTVAFWLVLTEDPAERKTLVMLVAATGVVFTVTGAVAAATGPTIGPARRCSPSASSGRSPPSRPRTTQSSSRSDTC